MATAAAPVVENPKNPKDLNLTPLSTDDAPPTHQPPPSDVGDGESNGKPAGTESAAKSSDADGGGPDTDIQKKMKRAERFGTAVHLSEEEKRNTRAERFGTASVLNGSDSSKQSEELKRKARAERFGVVQSTPTDDEVKKKARHARFGSSSLIDPAEEDKKKVTLEGKKTTTEEDVKKAAEEDKKKARALRFAQPDASSKENGEVNIKKATGASKVDGGT